MAILSLFGLLIDPTNQYNGSKCHKIASHYFVTLITSLVSAILPLSLIILSFILLGSISSSPYQELLREHRILLGLLGTWSGLEIGWYFYTVRLKQKFKVPTSFPSLSQEVKLFYLDRILSHCSNPLSALQRWFYSHPKESVGLECMEEWMAWAFFSKRTRFEIVEPQDKADMTELMSIIKEKCPDMVEKFEKDKDSKEVPLKFMRLHFDPLITQHKPLIAYLVISIIQQCGEAYLKYRLGFKHHSLPENTPLSYWCYEPDTTSQLNEPPIFILPGIGIGLTMYLSVIKSVSKLSSNRSMFILNLPHISLNIVSTVPTSDSTISSIDSIFLRHSLPSTGVAFLAHSYGSIVATWIHRKRPRYIASLTLVDPVCFGLWEPDLIYNFFYRKPAHPIHRVFQYFVGQDLCVS